MMLSAGTAANRSTTAAQAPHLRETSQARRWPRDAHGRELDASPYDVDPVLVRGRLLDHVRQ
jgi:hypothetical protein